MNCSIDLQKTSQYKPLSLSQFGSVHWFQLCLSRTQPNPWSNTAHNKGCVDQAVVAPGSLGSPHGGKPAWIGKGQKWYSSSLKKPLPIMIDICNSYFHLNLGWEIRIQLLATHSAMYNVQKHQESSAGEYREKEGKGREEAGDGRKPERGDAERRRKICGWKTLHFSSGSPSSGGGC